MTSMVLGLLLVLCVHAQINEISGQKENQCPSRCQCNHLLMAEINKNSALSNIQRHRLVHTITNRMSERNSNSIKNAEQKILSSNAAKIGGTRTTKSNVSSKTLEKSFDTSYNKYTPGEALNTAPLPLAVACHNTDQVPLVEDGNNIITLQLVNTSLNSLHASFTSKLSNLEWLSLNNTRLEVVVPGTLQAMPRLTELWISNCRFALILDQDTFTGCNHLRKISIQHCKLQSVDKNMFANLKSLHYLDMSHNNLISTSDASTKQDGGQPVPTSWGLQLPDSIQELILSHNNIINLERITSSSLTSLDICFNSFSTITPEQMALPQLVALCIGGFQLELTTGLLRREKFPQLARLAIKGTKHKELQVKDRPATDLQKMIREKLYTLELENCRLFVSQLVMRMPGSGLRYLRVINTTIITMRSTRNVFEVTAIASLDFSGTPFLAQAFLNPPPYVQVNKSFPHLTTLVLANTNTKKFRGNLFSQLPRLTELDISRNPLDCTCENFGWLLGYVALNRLTLLNANTTECAYPEYMKGKLILKGNLCSDLVDGANNTAVTSDSGAMEKNSGNTAEWTDAANYNDVIMSSNEVSTASGVVGKTAPEYPNSPLTKSCGQGVAIPNWQTVISLVTFVFNSMS